MIKKEIEICEVEFAFEEIFCLRSILSNDDIISAWRKGLKTGMDFRGLIWKRVWKRTFFVWNRVRIWRIGRHNPTKNSQEYPPDPTSVTHVLFRLFKISILVKQNHQWVPSYSHPPVEGGGGWGQRDPQLLLLTICLGSVAGVKRGKSDWKEVGVGGVANLIPRN